MVFGGRVSPTPPLSCHRPLSGNRKGKKPGPVICEAKVLSVFWPRSNLGCLSGKKAGETRLFGCTRLVTLRDTRPCRGDD